MDAGMDPFNNPAVQADFAHHCPTIVARRTADTSARRAPDSLCAAYAPHTTLSTAGPAHRRTQHTDVLSAHVQQPANYTAVPSHHLQQPVQPQSFVPASEPVYAQTASHTFMPVDLSDRMGSPYPPTEHTFEGVNNEDWDEIVAEPHPAPANAPAPDLQEYDNDFMEDDEQVFNAPTPAPCCENSQRPYAPLQGVCASMHNPANHSCHAPGTSHQYHTAQLAPASRASAPSTLEAFLMKENAKLKELIAQLCADNKALSNKLDKLIAELHSNNPAAAAPQPDVAQSSSASCPNDQMETSEAYTTAGNAPPSGASPDAQAPGPAPAPAPTTSACPTRELSYADTLRQSGAPAEKIAEARRSLNNLLGRKCKAAPAEKLTLIYVGGIQRKAISKVKKNLLSLGFDIRSTAIANISFLGASTCEFLVAPHYVSYFKRHITEINHPLLRLLENFEACKAADPAISPALKEALRSSLIDRVHGIIGRDGALPSVKKFFEKYLAGHSLPAYVPDAMKVDAPANSDEIPLDSTQPASTPVPKSASAPETASAPAPEAVPAPVTNPASAPSVATPLSQETSPANVPVTASAPPLTQC
ncbi:hypothetical protein DSO57_1027813 [Entomophthora muscae]|uniref:Uncharacterized protein n=1 Tax=Entomophthora muscae TaxID=34485 RepID=A0ACC2UB33_9FUNG|nr:hypothetical protein DSO57_1027813 [Entomophthora muscae]